MEDIQLTEDQYSASMAFTDFLLDPEQKYMVIQGAAGTGKSTLMKHLIDTVHSRMKLYSLLIGKNIENGEFDIELTATTNKAAVVLAEMTGYPPKTIHSCLNLKPKQDFKTGELHFVKGRDFQPLYNKLLIIDEGSFIDDPLFLDIHESTINCKIVIVGDQYQLAPVKQKIPIMERIDCPKVSLEKIMRHGGAIAEAGAKYRETVKTGIFTDIIPDGEHIIHVDGPTFQKMVDAAFLDPTYTAGKARVLAWTNFKVQQYNEHIRKILGHPTNLGPGDALITNKPIHIVRSGTKHALYTTDAPVSIKEVGKLVEEQGIKGRYVQLDYGCEFFLPENQLEVTSLLKSIAKQKDWPRYFDIKDTWLDLRPVFASTVHKSQGSTYDTVFINLTDIGKCHIASDVARMMYVAITRAAKKVVLYGELPAKYRGN